MFETNVDVLASILFPPNWWFFFFSSDNMGTFFPDKFLGRSNV